MRPTLSNHIALFLADADIIRMFGLPPDIKAQFEKCTPVSVSDHEIISAEHIELLAQAENLQQLAVAFGQALPLSASGTLGTLTRLAPTVRHALEALCKFSGFLVPILTPALSEKTVRGTLCATLNFNHNLSPNAEILTTLVMLIVAHRELTSWGTATNAVISFQLREGLDWQADILKPVLGPEVSVNGQRTEFTLPISLVNTVNPNADELSFNALSDDLNLTFAAANQSATTCKVKELLAATFPASPPVEGVAKNMGLTTRQLTYALRKEHTSYQAILREFRVSAAQDLLMGTPRARIETIAETMGYSDLAAFSQAFKNWTGMSPSEFRNKRSD